jgi:hypothetical protein
MGHVWETQGMCRGKEKFMLHYSNKINILEFDSTKPFEEMESLSAKGKNFTPLRRRSIRDAVLR